MVVGACAQVARRTREFYILLFFRSKFLICIIKRLSFYIEKVKNSKKRAEEINDLRALDMINEGRGGWVVGWLVDWLATADGYDE